MNAIKSMLGRSDRDEYVVPVKTQAYMEKLLATMIKERLPLLHASLESDMYVICALAPDYERVWFRIPHYRVQLTTHPQPYLVLTSPDPIDQLIQRLGVFGNRLSRAEKKRITEALGFTSEAQLLLPMPLRTDTWPRCR